MADGDTPDYTDQSNQQQPASQTPQSPTQQQESDVNQQLFGGKKPDEAATARRAMPVDPEKAQGDYYLQKRTELFQKDEDARARHEALLESYWQKLQDTKNQAHPELPKQEPESPMPGSAQDPNRNRQNVGQIFGQVMALATIASVVFGKRHGQRGRAIQQAGIGEFLKHYSAAQHQTAQDQLYNWQKANESIKEHNRQLVQDYRNILADRRLTLSEQHQLISDLSQARQDYKLSQTAASKDLSGILKNFADKDKADIATSKAALSILNTVHKEYFSNKGVRNWVDQVREKTGKDPLSSPEALRDAEKKYPMSQWVDDAGKVRTDDDSGEKKAGESAKEGGTMPTFNVTQAKQQPVGTEFISPNGTHYKVISQDPFQVQKMGE